MPNKNDISSAINTRATNIKCPFCESNNWDINENVAAAMPIDANGGFVVGKGQITPSVHITCLKCGYIAHFNPLLLGLNIE